MTRSSKPRVPEETRRSFLQKLGGALPGVLIAKSWLAAGSALASAPALQKLSLSELDEGEDFEVCVVGSGPAGAVLAAELVSSGVKTLVIESGTGPGVQDARFAELDVYSTSGQSYALQQSRFRGVGGTSNLWTGACTRLDPSDLAPDNPYAPPGAPWPLSYSELEPFYARAEAELRVRGDDRTSVAPWRSAPYPLSFEPDQGTSYLEGALAGADLPLHRVPLSDFGGNPLRTAITHLPAFSSSPHGTLAVGCTVTKILAGPAGNIRGLRVAALDGTVRTLRARRYVIANGVVETCRLFLLSRTEFKGGIGRYYSFTHIDTRGYNADW